MYSELVNDCVRFGSKLTHVEWLLEFFSTKELARIYSSLPRPNLEEFVCSIYGLPPKLQAVRCIQFPGANM